MDYNKIRYLDKYMKMDNMNYEIVTEDDINDIKNVIDFAEGLVIKNYDEAMKYETLDMSKAADVYSDIINDTSKSALSDLEKQTIIRTYKERNKYYLELHADYNIDYLVAREAKDFDILKATNNSLSDSDKNLFYEAYRETVDYYFQVLHTSAFKGEELYKEYFRELVIFFAVQRYLTKKMERYFDIDRYTKTDCKNTFISYGIDYFDGLPLTYQKKLIKMINPIIQYKGTNKCFELILEAFGFDNVKIDKYTLAKDWENNDLFFYKTPIDQNLNVETDTIQDFDEVIVGDAMWQASKEEILKKDFNVVDSKYVSVEIFSDILKNSNSTAYLVSLAYALENRFKMFKDTDNFTFINKNISSKPIDIFNALIAVIILLLKRYKVTNKLNYGNVRKQIWGFGALSDNDIIEPFLRELKNEIINSEYWLKKDGSYTILYEFFDSFALESFTQASLYTKTYIKSCYTQDIYEQLWKASINYSYPNIISKLSNGKVDSEYVLFDCLQFFSEKLILNKIDIIKFKKNYPDLYNYLIKYNIYKYNDINKPFENFKRILDNNVIVKTQMELLLYELDNEELNKEFIRYGFTIKCFTLLKGIIDDNRKDIVTADNIEVYRSVLKRNPKDILYYEELSNYFEMFTQFNIQQDVYYTIDEFMTILKYNIGLKEQLEQFIAKTNNYKLYKNYLLLWEKAFTEYENMDLYASNECISWDDYLLKYDNSLYEYTKVPVSIAGDDQKEQEWYDSVIFELCESLDIFANDPNTNYFIENEFIGISDFVKKYITIALMVFKAYTTDIIGNNYNYIYDDPAFNNLKLFDTFEVTSETEGIIDNIDMQESMFEYEKVNMTEQVTYMETLTITNIVLETNDRGELITDINGNYIERLSYEDDVITDITHYDINW